MAIIDDDFMTYGAAVNRPSSEGAHASGRLSRG